VSCSRTHRLGRGLNRRPPGWKTELLPRRPDASPGGTNPRRHLKPLRVYVSRRLATAQHPLLLRSDARHCSPHWRPSCRVTEALSHLCNYLGNSRGKYLHFPSTNLPLERAGSVIARVDTTATKGNYTCYFLERRRVREDAGRRLRCGCQTFFSSSLCESKNGILLHKRTPFKSSRGTFTPQVHLVSAISAPRSSV